MTAASKRHLSRVAALGCIVCASDGIESEAEIHHVRHGGEKRDDYKTIPLCPAHHRTGGYGVAVHAGRSIWSMLYGDETVLLRRVYYLLGEDAPAECNEMEVADE